MARLILLGAMAALFFSSTFVLNRAMSLDGGHWVWSASLRYAFMLPILLAWTAASGGPRADLTPQGKGISLAGRPQTYGIGIQADSRLEILAKRQFARFSAVAGVDDSSADAGGEVVFRVHGDRKLLFESAPLKRGSAPAAIDVDVSGVDILELSAESARGSTRPVVVAWGDARFD